MVLSASRGLGAGAADGVALGLTDGALVREYETLDGDRLEAFDELLDMFRRPARGAVVRPDLGPEDVGQLLGQGASVLVEDPGDVQDRVDRQIEIENSTPRLRCAVATWKTSSSGVGSTTPSATSISMSSSDSSRPVTT